MRLLFYGLLICTSILWAGNFVAGKFLVGHASPLTLTTMRWAVAILVLLPIVRIFDGKLLPQKKALLPLFLMGLTGVVFFNIFMFLALERTSADNVGLLSALNPVAIAIASFLLLKETMSSRQMTGMLVSLAGVLLVISHGNLQRLLEFRFNTGDLFMLAAVGTWGLYAVAGRKAMACVSPYMSTLWAGIFGVLTLLPFNLPNLEVRNPDLAFWIATGYVSVGATVLAMVFWNIGVQRVGGTKAGMFLNFNPIFTAILAYVFLGELMTWIQVAGTVLVIGGVYLFTTRSKRQVPVAKGQSEAA
ncbi:DMT family transporter [Effusibacillus lacus]|uniref:EamA family transporter n=1 Tax=Effusibacillus lacus TaxID=1348429 RepID=A0A292YTV1_9BACL|nr:DMT family transporter [Effusibacillus lacus]TCS76378.1 threonine/homoserine efflux transporter RhtA [Effusibacillus lacus]GAX91920.1 EamA family transporter [Effusibacillus lacus]